MSGETAMFSKYIERLGVDWERVLSSGLSMFIKRQEPQKVVFKVHTDSDKEVTGYSIQVKATEENVKEAKEFWENNVEPKLNK